MESRVGFRLAAVTKCETMKWYTVNQILLVVLVALCGNIFNVQKEFSLKEEKPFLDILNSNGK